MTNGLWLVDMTQSQIVEAAAEGVGILRLQFANLEVVTSDINSCYGLMGHHYHGKTESVILCHLIKNGLNGLFAFASHIR